MPYKYPIADLKAALEKAEGDIRAASRALNCSPHTFYDRMEKDESLKEICRRSRGIMVNTAASQLGYAVERGEAWAVRLALMMFGGFAEHHEISGELTWKEVIESAGSKDHHE